MNCIKIGLPGKLILSKRKGLLEDSENQFSGKTYFHTIASRRMLRQKKIHSLKRQIQIKEKMLEVRERIKGHNI